jgi:AraC family transcriptional regulator
MRRGDMDFVPFGYAAAWQDRSPGRVLNVRLNPSFVRSTAEAMNSGHADAVCVPPQLHFTDSRLESLGWALVAELEGDDHGDRLLAESVGTAMAAHLLRRYGAMQSVGSWSGLSRRRLLAVLDYINENLAENFGLVELASLAGVSPSHFKALFKQSTGVPVHQYVIRQRVDRAVHLIVGGGARLCDVAQQAGFAHQSHMARCMRRVVGMTPADVLREFR